MQLAGEKEPEQEEERRKRKEEQMWEKKKGDYGLCNKSLFHQGPTYLQKQGVFLRNQILMDSVY